MANYHSPTVVQQVIPKSDMTALEILILSQIFDADIEGEAVYLCTSESPCDTIWVAADALRAALDDPRANHGPVVSGLSLTNALIQRDLSADRCEARWVMTASSASVKLI
jgi:hypothetical protein